MSLNAVLQNIDLDKFWKYSDNAYLFKNILLAIIFQLMFGIWL